VPPWWGQLAVVEMTSIGPMERFGHTLERFGIGPEGRRFYEVHRDIDARHANIARERMVTGLLSADPHLETEVLFGAGALLLLEENFATHLLDAWEQNRSSLVPWESSSEAKFRGTPQRPDVDSSNRPSPSSREDGREYQLVRILPPPGLPHQ